VSHIRTSFNSFIIRRLLSFHSGIMSYTCSLFQSTHPFCLGFFIPAIFVWVYAPSVFHLGLCTHYFWDYAPFIFGTMHPLPFIWAYIYFHLGLRTCRFLFGIMHPLSCLGLFICLFIGVYAPATRYLGLHIFDAVFGSHSPQARLNFCWTHHPLFRLCFTTHHLLGLYIHYHYSVYAFAFCLELRTSYPLSGLHTFKSLTRVFSCTQYLLVEFTDPQFLLGFKDP
jgi:hypothetical protein